MNVGTIELTYRDHLAAIALDEPDAFGEVMGPVMPLGTQTGWVHFWDLNETRSTGPNGPDPINHREIRAFQDNVQVELTPFDVLVIVEADKAMRREYHERVAARRAKTDASTEPDTEDASA